MILEGFAKKHINKDTGGPRNVEMLFSREELKTDFIELSQLKIEEVEVTLKEGNHHEGVAALIRLTGKK